MNSNARRNKKIILSLFLDTCHCVFVDDVDVQNWAMLW
jgi:hypothetical protein